MQATTENLVFDLEAFLRPIAVQPEPYTPKYAVNDTESWPIEGYTVHQVMGHLISYKRSLTATNMASVELMNKEINRVDVELDWLEEQHWEKGVKRFCYSIQKFLDNTEHQQDLEDEEIEEDFRFPRG